MARAELNPARWGCALVLGLVLLYGGAWLAWWCFTTAGGVGP